VSAPATRARPVPAAVSNALDRCARVLGDAARATAQNGMVPTSARSPWRTLRRHSGDFSEAARAARAVRPAEHTGRFTMSRTTVVAFRDPARVLAACKEAPGDCTAGTRLQEQPRCGISIIERGEATSCWLISVSCRRAPAMPRFVRPVPRRREGPPRGGPEDCTQDAAVAVHEAPDTCSRRTTQRAAAAFDGGVLFGRGLFARRRAAAVAFYAPFIIVVDPADYVAGDERDHLRAFAAHPAMQLMKPTISSRRPRCRWSGTDRTGGRVDPLKAWLALRHSRRQRRRVGTARPADRHWTQKSRFAL